jgi:hypothetical protein
VLTLQYDPDNRIQEDDRVEQCRIQTPCYHYRSQTSYKSKDLGAIHVLLSVPDTETHRLQGS